LSSVRYSRKPRRIFPSLEPAAFAALTHFVCRVVAGRPVLLNYNMSSNALIVNEKEALKLLAALFCAPG
jgi:hypothetical protein